MTELERERQIDTLEHDWRDLDRHAVILPLSGMQAALRNRLWRMWKQLRGDPIGQ